MFALGGWSGGSATSMVEVYDIRTDKWTTVTSADTGKSRTHVRPMAKDNGRKLLV